MLTTATALQSRSRGMCSVIEGHCFCRSSTAFKASAVQSATIQPQSSVLKEKPPYRDRVQQCSSLQSCNSQSRPSHHRTAAPKLGIVEQTLASAQGLPRTSCPSGMPSDLSNKTGLEPNSSSAPQGPHYVNVAPHSLHLSAGPYSKGG